jgi:hypothetical protein
MRSTRDGTAGGCGGIIADDIAVGDPDPPDHGEPLPTQPAPLDDDDIIHDEWGRLILRHDRPADGMSRPV